MSPINLHDIYPVTAGIRVGTLLESGEHDNVKRATPALLKLASFRESLLLHFSNTCRHKTFNSQCADTRIPLT